MEVFPRGEVFVHTKKIGNVPDGLAHQLRIGPNVNIHDLGAAKKIRLQGREHANCGRLTGPIRTNKSEDFTRWDLQRNPFHRLQFPVANF